MHRFRPLLGVLLALAACGDPPIAWTDPLEVRVPAREAQFRVDAEGHADFVADTAALVTVPQSMHACVASVRGAAGPTRLHAVWWRTRADNSAVLETAASVDGGRSWGTAVMIDTLDRSSRGCDRPPPSPTTVGDDLYVAYSMVAPEGTGVFFAHFMSGMLHSPVAVIYGERLVATDIAVEGDRVAVAYEEPNGGRQQVDVALSTTQGHIFEVHETASRSVDVAQSPWVALAGPFIAVAWQTRGADSSVSVARVGRLH